MSLIDPYRGPDKLPDLAAITDAIDDATAQLNACSVALDRLGLGGDPATVGDHPRWKLLEAFCRAHEAKKGLLAEQLPA